MNLVACGGFKESIEDTQRVQAAVKAELGVDANVAFRTTNGHTTVTVRLAAPPAGDAAEAKRKVTDIVNRNFRTKVEAVDLSI